MSGAPFVGLALEALDALFFRDGRPFDASSRVEGRLPTPQTFAGALRTALLARHGFDFAAFTRARRRNPGAEARHHLVEAGAPTWALDVTFRGPWLAIEEARDTVSPLLPVPQILARRGKKGEGQWFRMEPRESVPGWSDPNRRPLWLTAPADAKHPGGYLTLPGVAAFLKGGLPGDGHWFEQQELCGYEARTGIEINADSLTASEGGIYSVHLLVLRRKIGREGSPAHDRPVRLYAEASLPPGHEQDLDGPLPLGGEGKYVHVRRTQPVPWHEHSGGGGLWLLATPGLFAPTTPDRPDTMKCVAASSGSPLAVSGWDVARGGPRATRFAVPGGAVYFTTDQTLTAPRSLCGVPEDAAQGWGFALPGAWNP